MKNINLAIKITVLCIFLKSYHVNSLEKNNDQVRVDNHSQLTSENSSSLKNSLHINEDDEKKDDSLIKKAMIHTVGFTTGAAVGGVASGLGSFIFVASMSALDSHENQTYGSDIALVIVPYNVYSFRCFCRWLLWWIYCSRME